MLVSSLFKRSINDREFRSAKTSSKDDTFHSASALSRFDTLLHDVKTFTSLHPTFPNDSKVFERFYRCYVHQQRLFGNVDTRSEDRDSIEDRANSRRSNVRDVLRVFSPITRNGNKGLSITRNVSSFLAAKQRTINRNAAIRRFSPNLTSVRVRGDHQQHTMGAELP